MDVSVMLLDKALSLGQEELAAILAGDVSTASILSEQREEAVTAAWDHREAVISEAYCTKLLELQQLQATLTHEAKALKQTMGNGLRKAHSEGRRLAGYRKAVSHALV